MLAAISTLSAQTPTTSDEKLYTIDEEIQLGQSVALQVEGSLSLVTDEKLPAYVTKLGAALSDHVAVNPFSFTFKIYSEKKPGGAPITGLTLFPYGLKERENLEPIALAGGPIYVPLDLLRKAYSEAELAAMLAHSMAHIVLRHQTRMALYGQSARPGTPAPIGLLGQARKFELDADALAVRILADAGYNPSGLASFLKKLLPDERSTEAVMLSSLPAVPSRIEAIENVIEALPRQDYTAQTGEFPAISAKLKVSP
ncbi:MAG TPA: M48 family metalloprotease [Bryobacteraceae bacterium]|nr:M48 family metalloprotease [Bryobacteraceae bacterium]